MNDDLPPPTRPGVDPEVAELAADDLDDLVHALEGVSLSLAGVISLLRAQAAAARREGLQ